MLKNWLFRIDRLVIWPLLIATLLFLATGFSMTHEAYRLMSIDSAWKIHTSLHPVFISLFFIHVVIRIFFAVERWKRHVETPFLVQLGRFSGWALLVTVFLYMLSGYAMLGSLPLDVDTSTNIHKSLDVVIIIFLLHAGITSYYALRKWTKS